MVHADKLTKLTSSQIINPDKIDKLCTSIKSIANRGYTNLSIEIILTKAEITYLQLYGYKVDYDFDDYIVISWGF